jgi:hypothetical protein
MGAALSMGCGRPAGVYPPPPQRSTDLGPDPGGVGPFVAMDDATADDYIVSDIISEHGYRRWAFLHPELRFKVKSVDRLKFAVEFAVPEVTFKDTGPITVACAVNGRTLATVHCVKAGDYKVEQPVPKGLVEAEKIIRVTFETTPRWVSPLDGAQLSFLLRSAGFIQ